MTGFDLALDLSSTGTWLTGARVVGIVGAAYLATLWVALVVWTARDIEARTDDQSTRLMSIGIVAALFVPGLLLYMAMRPSETRVDAYNRKLEEEAFLREVQRMPTCPDCRRSVESNFVVCPYCRTTLRTACESCGEPLSGAWAACPWCGSEKRVAASRRRLEPVPAQGRERRPQREPARPTAVQPQI